MWIFSVMTLTSLSFYSCSFLFDGRVILFCFFFLKALILECTCLSSPSCYVFIYLFVFCLFVFQKTTTSSGQTKDPQSQSLEDRQQSPRESLVVIAIGEKTHSSVPRRRSMVEDPEASESETNATKQTLRSAATTEVAVRPLGAEPGQPAFDDELESPVPKDVLITTPSDDDMLKKIRLYAGAFYFLLRFTAFSRALATRPLANDASSTQPNPEKRARRSAGDQQVNLEHHEA